jgi:cyclophilin family peptidyl-prolyl cis-trans isomerase
LLAALISIASIVPNTSDATIVEFQTVMGNFEVNLYDNATPATVANFLAYVNSGDYTNTIYHRTVSGFIVQGGGFTFDRDLVGVTEPPVAGITSRPTVNNEPAFSNVRGTIAMAKLGNDPNSATNQWFFNLSNNSANLDVQNSGFTVFGEVVGNGMTVVDAIAALPNFPFGGAFDDLPLRDYVAADFNNNVLLQQEHMVIVNAIIVTDTTVDSAAGLNPPANTANSGGGGLGGDSGGGSLNFWAIFMLLAMMLGRQVIRPRT